VASVRTRAVNAFRDPERKCGGKPIGAGSFRCRVRA
jgi:hypothetical protein